ncbi:tRNA-specific 2-thiouridylase MnmA [hydrothermal vent metagenome]|uniref:tRNA-specific 2-thiouridylase MnmA n=1 Tax=hydrothermal vent metagenome TaxID=652676 RepID=A0A1W1EKC4_9ZZZZ
MDKVLVGMSGGVDSTVTAILLQQQGYEVVGVYMKLHTKEGYHEENFKKAQRVANYLNIDIHFLDLEDEFNSSVYDYFVDSYRVGLTPNPCVLCNRRIKFGKMIEFGDSLNIKYISTGHYAKTDGKYIYKAKDLSKDQSYFLAQINRDIVSRLIFPLGDMLKEDVKKIASNIDILQDIATQKESSEICFVENDYTEILEKYMDINIEGDTLNAKGEVVGNHKGYMHYTIGKRRGFFVNGAHEPHFVLDINAQKNEIIVGKKDELAVSEFNIKNISLFDDIEDSFEATIKVRYRTQGVEGRVDVANNKIELKSPVFGLAKEQVAVFYDDERLLGGAIIC